MRNRDIAIHAIINSAVMNVCMYDDRQWNLHDTCGHTCLGKNARVIMVTSTSSATEPHFFSVGNSYLTYYFSWHSLHLVRAVTTQDLFKTAFSGQGEFATAHKMKHKKNLQEWTRRPVIFSGQRQVVIHNICSIWSDMCTLHWKGVGDPTAMLK